MVAALGYLVVYADFPIPHDELAESATSAVIAFSAALLAMVVTLLALIHIIEHGNYRWLAPIFLFAYVGAYLYGFVVASRAKSNY